MRIVKRFVDFALALLAFVVLLPLMAGVAGVILVSMGSPVLFRDRRLGIHENTFVMWKFRTMTEARGPSGALLPDSERLTGVGRALRRASLDELPQLLNVVCGSMSIVGPRPLPPRYKPHFRDEERVRFSVRPGITGLALVLGRNDLPWDERLAADAWYVREWSLSLDFRIMLRTLWSVLMRRGVRVDPSAVMDDLDVERGRQ